MKNIILFGGSFDPIHNGHLNMALEAQKSLGGYEECSVFLVPNRVSVWKNKSIGPEHKYTMLELAIEEYKNFHIFDYELHNEEDNYTYLTIREFKEFYPDAKLYWLIGQDQVELFHLWKNVDEIVSNVTILYYKRSDNGAFYHKNISTYQMIEVKGEKIFNVSSSSIRNLQMIDMPFEALRYLCDNDLYFLPKVGTYIDERRYKHMKSVGLLAYKIALSNNVANPGKYFIAGLLHDIGKDVPQNYVEEIKKTYAEYMPLDEKLYHQFYSAVIAQRDFDINDEEILDAIRYHATGKAKMSLIAKAVYAADKIDPLRGYDSKDMINAMLEDIDKGFKFVLDENRKFLISRGKDVGNKLTKECFDQYLE